MNLAALSGKVGRAANANGRATEDSHFKQLSH
jgi:hypothetical protein